jgi:hypothetical protein
MIRPAARRDGNATKPPHPVMNTGVRRFIDLLVTFGGTCRRTASGVETHSRMRRMAGNPRRVTNAAVTAAQIAR